MKSKFDTSSYKISQLVTNHYSTSFSLGIKLFDPAIRPQIYAIYGFVRFVDEIVDSMQNYNQLELLESFVDEYKRSLKDKISLNPILNSFQAVVNKYDIEDLVEHFLASMRQDLFKNTYNTKEEYAQYIYGSADVVGLMCLKVFVNGDETEFNNLKPFAVKLGSAFQKVNFLRDLNQDYNELGRSYFPHLDFANFTEKDKLAIIQEIQLDFSEALIGIKALPPNSKLGVFVAYTYYLGLLNSLASKSVAEIFRSRIRISNYRKGYILLLASIKYKMNGI